MTRPISARPRDARLAVYVGLGVAAGVAYVVFDLLSESRIRSGTLTGTFAHAHDAIDHVFPVLVGALLGVCAHYLRLRAQLSDALEAAARAEALRTRLHKVERDQAVWVLAATVLHELNNPLHAMGLLLDELVLYQADDSRRGNLVDRARIQAERALSQLRLLRTMRGRGEPELQRIALDRVVQAVADDVRPLAEEEGLVLHAECSQAVHAHADPTYVRTILENLLDNSLHSLRAAGRGSITLRLSSEDGRALVRVCDDGPALDPRVCEGLFEPLRNSKANGLGLGLPIARALARAMRGDLFLDDPPLKAFRLELPLREGS